MLQELEIHNFGVIEKSRVEFKEGFTSLSGETGSGKSMVLQALYFALGQKLPVEAIRAGASHLEVRARFELPKTQDLIGFLENHGLEFEKEWILSRKLDLSGRSKAYFNDHSLSLKTLKRLGALLLIQANQHAALKLFDSEYALHLLDQFGGHQVLLEAYGKAYDSYLKKKSQLKNLQKNHQEAKEKQDYWSFQLKELQKANLKLGEKEELEQKKQKIKNRVQLLECLTRLLEITQEGEVNLSGQLSQALQWAQKAVRLDESYEPSLEVLTELRAGLENLNQDWSAELESLNSEGEDFESLEARLHDLSQLERKYSKSIAQLIEEQKHIQARLEDFNNFELIMDQARTQLNQAQKILAEEAAVLTEARKKSAKLLAKQALEILESLALPQARLKFQLRPLGGEEDFGPEGAELLEIWLSFNPGEALRPFQEVISGGELSRLLLALFLVIYPASPERTFVFDEVDSGVSGHVAELMARRLKQLSQKSQVLVVTHLPQVASQAHWHFRVEKTIKAKRTFTQIKALGEEERVEELARMLTGLKLTDKALEHAKEMLG